MAELMNPRLPAFGITVMAWHRGVFGVGISGRRIVNRFTALCLLTLLGTNILKSLLVDGAPVNAMLLYGAEVYDHTSNRVPDHLISRSPDRPINIVVGNDLYRSDGHLIRLCQRSHSLIIVRHCNQHSSYHGLLYVQAMERALQYR
jgi:hypothetical protein